MPERGQSHARRTPCRALTFDLDGTLLDGSPWRDVIGRTCDAIAAVHPGLEALRLLEANGEVWETYFPEVESSWALGVVDGKSVTAEAWRRTLGACGVDDAATATFATETYLRNRRAALRLFDDVPELFNMLGPDLPMALITNGASDTQRDAVRALGIEDRFRAILISGEVGITKPDPAIFDVAVDRLGIAHESVWHVGDNLRVDVEGAQRAHLTSVWLNRRGVNRDMAEPRPDYEVAELTDLPALLGIKR